MNDYHPTFNAITCYVPDMFFSHPIHELVSDVGTINDPTESKCKESVSQIQTKPIHVDVLVLCAAYLIDHI